MKTKFGNHSGNSLPMHSWPEADQPREKLLKLGRKHLSDAELLAILLGSGTKGHSALNLAQKILASLNHDLHELGNANLSKISSIHGVGPAKAVRIAAALELGARRAARIQAPKSVIRHSADAAQLIQWRFIDISHEEFWILLLNRANACLGSICISKGGMTGTLADARLIFRTALEHKATAIILVHNHPAGTMKPSEADIRLTKKLRDAGKVLDIEVLDHIIIAGDAYFSFCDEGLMPD